jgi:hypothetical protein
MNLKRLYLAIAILGTILPLYLFSQFLLENGVNFPLFLRHMMANDIASFFAWDVIISSLAVITLVLTEWKRLRMKNLWLYVLLNLTIGISLALPAFLYIRAI